MDKKRKEKRIGMDYLWLLLILAVWVVLQAFVLPKFGIST